MHPPLRIRAVLLWALTALGLGLAACGARADQAGAIEGAGAPFGVRSAYLQLIDGVYLLSARLSVPVDEGLRAVLKDGVAVRLGLELKVIRQRSYWMDEEVAALTQNYQLRYHAVSDRYLVRNLNGGEQLTFPTLEDALRELAQIRHLPALDQALVRKDRQYEATLRATLEVGEVPAALRWLMFWADDGRRASEWYTWRVLQ
jgi:hypothetical protein